MRRIFDFILLLMICLSVLLCGRSGVFVIVFFMPAAFFLSGRRDWLQRCGRLFGAAALFALLLAALGIFRDTIDSIAGRAVASNFELAVHRDFETFSNYSELGIAGDETISDLYRNHLVIPESPAVFFFGDVSNMELDRRGVESDIGYVRLLFAYGLFGSLLQYAFYGLSLKYLYEVRTRSPELVNIAFLTVAVIAVFQAKEVFVFSRIGLSITTLFTLAALAAGRFRRVRRQTDFAVVGKSR